MPRPLTKTKVTGEPYVRPPEIDAAIDVALAQDLCTVVARAAVRDRDAAGFLGNEVLVHMIREALRRSDDRALNQLVPILLERGRTILRSKVPDSAPYALEIRSEVLGRLSELIAEDAADDQTRLDVYECRFELAFRSLRCDVVRQFRRRAREVSAHTDDQGEDQEEDEVTKRELPADRDLEPRPVAIAKEMLAAIDALPANERKAFVLHHVYGFKIESDDPTKTTVATLCGVTGRTVRNLLHRAKTKLAAQEMKQS